MTQPQTTRWGGETSNGAPDNRLVASAAHTRIRARILSGELAAGTIISQVELAAELGISRTPLREALRMLQEEGLVEAEPNRRCRVAGFDAVELDATYGTRLMLEALGMRLTLDKLPGAALDHAATLLDELEALGGPAAGDVWQRTHHEFHQTFVSGAPRPLLDQITSHAQRSERYVYQLALTAPAGTGRPAEHRQILDQAAAGAVEDAIITTARHMARTPLLLLAEFAAEMEPTAIRTALSMLAALKGDPVAERRGRRISS